MTDKKTKPKRRLGCWAAGMFLLVLIGAVGVSYAMGWVAFYQGEGTFTIEFRTGEVTQDTDKAVKEGKRAAKETGKAMQRAGRKLEELGDDSETSSEGDNAPSQNDTTPGSRSSQNRDATSDAAPSDEAPSTQNGNSSGSDL